MPPKLEELDQRILDVLQTGVPLVRRPFAEVATQLDSTEAEILRRVGALKSLPHNIIRQISAIFDSASLGYATTLVAAKIDEAKLEAAAAVINQHPGVSHNYKRSHSFNLWYTLAVPPDSKIGLERTLEILHQQSGAISTRMLPTLKLYKIGVRMDLREDADASARSDTPGGYNQANRDAAPPITEADKIYIRLLQQDLAIQAEPFNAWAKEAGVSVDELLDAAQRYVDTGVMRRFAAVLRHRAAGISANAMGVWNVPPEGQDAFGLMAAGFTVVSHCYLRRSYPDWPYTIFTMVHAPTKEKCEAALAAIAAATKVYDYSALYSTVEYKKVRVKYFTPESAAWEQQFGP